MAFLPEDTVSDSARTTFVQVLPPTALQQSLLCNALSSCLLAC